MNQHRIKKARLLAATIVLFSGNPSFARIPEPDVIYYGDAIMNGVPFTAGNTGVQIRAEVNGIPLVTYSMGDIPSVGDRYVLYIPMDSLSPPEPDTAQEGDMALFYLSTGGQDFHVATVTLGPRGSVTQFTLDATDSDNDGLSNSVDDDDDNDGLPDQFELQYGLNPLDASDALLDWDLDGITTLAEYQNGTNPNSFDSDGDGIDDDQELNQGRDPLQPDLPVDLRPGLNLFALPVAPTNGLTSADVLTALGPAANSISRFDSGGTTVEKTTLVNGSIGGPVFMIVEGEGYLLDMNQNYQQLWSGPYSLVVPDLLIGLNIVTFASAPEGLTAQLLIEQVVSPGAIASIQRFNRDSGRFEAAVYDSVQGFAAGFNFPIMRGEAYLISMSQNVNGTGLPQAPEVTISDPVLGLATTSATIDVIGTVDDSNAQVLVNGIAANVAGGIYIANGIPLSLGINTLTVVAEDLLGLKGRTARRIVRNP